MAFTTAADLVFRQENTQQQGRFDQYMKCSLLRPKVLIIDEVGHLPLRGKQANLFFKVIAKRYEHGFVMLSSNLSIGE